jgi:hypothetical protein
MSGLYNQFKTDGDLEKTGIILDYGPNSKGKPMQIRIARAGGTNIAFSKAFERHTKPYRRMFQTGVIDESLSQQVMREVYVDAVVLGWENIEDEAGKELIFSGENVKKVFTDLPDLFADIIEQSKNAALFRATIREADLKN